MFTSSSRRTAGLLALAWVFAVSMPVAAADPTPSPELVPAPEPPIGAPTVHAEMLAEHAADPITFDAGPVPQALVETTPDGGGTMSLSGGTGGIAALPNGLSNEVFGYLPYWMLGATDLANLRYDLVSTIAYFGVAARSNGTLAKSTSGVTTTEWAGWTSSAMSNVISKAHQRGVRVVLTVTMMAWNGDYSAMENLLTSSTRRARLVGEIASALKARNADGVNVDFEPVPSSLRSPFTRFVRELKAGLLAQGAGSYVTVASMAGAATWSTGYDLAGLTASGGADALMVMAYDFNWSGSARAGGVAPYVSPYIFDAKTALAHHLQVVPASKLIWGAPYYGRAWTTQSSTLNSLTCRSSSICPTAKSGSGAIGRSWAPRYVDALDEIAVHGRRWDDTGRVPWYRYQSSKYGTWVQGYYDDHASLKAKYTMVKSNGLRGVGIWHLLMDGTRSELWDTLYTQFGPLPFTDIAGSEFVHDIVWLAGEGITNGCGKTTFCPRDAVTRAQMASFLVRAFDLPRASKDYFGDDDGTTHENNINRLAEADITTGCGGGRFCPDEPVTRAQMASFLARALKLPTASHDWFRDDSGLVHEDNINRLADSGITEGCATNLFCPSVAVKRQHMAAFLHRALGGS
jgi:spore germination protein YaaH